MSSVSIPRHGLPSSLRLAPIVIALALLAAGASASVAQTGDYAIRRLGLTGPAYQHNVPGGFAHETTLLDLNEVGDAAGETTRFTSAGQFNGQQAWLLDGATTHVLPGLTGGVYEYTTGNGLFVRTDVGALNNLGQTVGHSARFSDSSDTTGALGRDAWFDNGTTVTQIGLVGAGYERTIGAGVNRVSSASHLNDAGRAAGTSSRFDAGGNALGADSWRYNGTTTQAIGPTDAAHQYNAPGGVFRNSAPSVFNGSGQTAGLATRFGAAGETLGSDPWFFNGTSTQIIGLTGGVYQHSASPGGVVSVDLAPQAINDAGRVAGVTYRWSAAGVGRGFDSWVFNGATTERAGLVGADYEISNIDGVAERYSLVVPALSILGVAAGRSTRFNAAGVQLGQDAWVYTGVGTQLVGLTGAGYQFTNAAGVNRSGLPLDVNAVGQVLGVAQRYSAAGGDQGRAGWFHDAITGITTPLAFSVRPSDNFSSTTPLFLNDAGVVFGTYELFDVNTLLGNHFFWWSLATGVHDLGLTDDLVEGGLTAAGWQSLTEFAQTAGSIPAAPPKYLAGTGRVLGQASGNSIFLLTADGGGSFQPADFNGDTEVDGADLDAWDEGYGTTGNAQHADGDADDDLDVDGNDFLLWQRQLGSDPPALAATAAVPEPGGAILGVVACAALVRSRRRR